MSALPHIRCAVYTRKSSDDGLNQEFNSLDAQFEACAAYIASQRHEGWRLLPARYDDGGLSGGTLERPALQRLMADIDAGQIGMIVVYKIDRLTRSLADFAKLVERLDAAGCSFVSVTQAFNTSSSMGRLTLNVLLSFAQFEREVTAERIRDKIAASKKKGLWMGGTVPLGYDPHPDPLVRELVVNEAEAPTVRTVFQLYTELKSLRGVEDRAKALGLISKPRTAPNGETTGGQPLSRGQLHYLLSNPIYRGQIRHKNKIYAGLHPAIIDAPLWDSVQSSLQEASQRPRGRRSSTDSSASCPAATSAAALIGMVRDETGDRLTPSHTLRRGRRFCYYVSNRLISGGIDTTGWRLPAAGFEHAVLTILIRHLKTAAKSQTVLTTPEASTAALLSNRITALIEHLKAKGALALPKILLSVIVCPKAVHLTLSSDSLTDWLSIAPGDYAEEFLSFTAPLTIRRRGVETRIATGEVIPAPDATLLRVLAQAHVWTERLRTGTPLAEVAAQAGHSTSYIRTRAPLAFLSPTIQKHILAGTHPIDLSLARLIRSKIPLCWREQERTFGFSEA
ncbi:Site-specific DNA recombinase [Sulfitobacter brevis]|uniref:Site-specific DNA recombinase n=1 Tax=Sulfitobacter brevis TaxID=74348 RepID=A0A1I2FRK0_9RHOB|nr:recombinase family protein [Sulfitobacter brevis]SFF07623.1 Site-specific DNA recombinase [Sulfitobacter brevis]